jgi:type VI protein secretion system component VasA
METTKTKQVEGNLLAGLATYALFAKRQGRTEMFEWAEQTLARLGFYADAPEDASRLDRAIRAALLGYAGTAAMEGNQAVEQLALDAFKEFGFAQQLAALPNTGKEVAQSN